MDSHSNTSPVASNEPLQKPTEQSPGPNVKEHSHSPHGQDGRTTTKHSNKNNAYFWPQINTLATKNLTILISRHFVSTFYAALMLPILMSIYLGIGQNLQGSGNTYGFTNSDPSTLPAARSFTDGLDLAANKAGRNNVVFCNSGLAGGDIDRVIDALEAQVQQAGKLARRITNAADLGKICTVSFQGTTPCYGAVVFSGSPNEGSGSWNYTLRGDGVLGRKYDADTNDNDPQVYILPFQRAIDSEIARLENGSSSSSSSSINDLARMQEWLYTSSTEQERREQANRDYENTFINFMGVAILVGFFGISYHLPGYIATEREKGLSQLVDAMMHTRHRSAWEAPALRMLAHLLSFAAVYFPGWVAGSLVLKFMIWRQTSVGVVLPYFVLAGLASASQALATGSLFRRAQLSGVVGGLGYILLGVLVQAVPDLGTGGAVVLGLLFPSSNMVLQIKYMSRAEAAGFPANLLRPPPESDHQLPSIVLWVFLIVQAVVYPFVAAGLERRIHGAAADSRVVWTGPSSATARPEHAVTVEGLTRTFSPSLFRRMFSFISAPRPATVAVNDLNLSIPRGQIVALLGANGSGKSTTLDAVAGLQSFARGRVTIDASGGVGVAPQKNVLWDELTVWEHVQLFNKLKKPQHPAKEQELKDLLRAVGLSTKSKAKSSTLSGGQKRKLQLAMMLTGDSAVCCVDEVSSGIDPLSRRKIWDILLAERGRRTIILTTHFLDEADLLSDKIAIMSNGVLRAEGSAVELKANLGSGFHIHLSRPREHQQQQQRQPPQVEGVQVKVQPDSVVYAAPTSEAAACVIRALEAKGIAYRVSSPTIEDVFLHVADEYASESVRETSEKSGGQQQQPLDLLSGRPVGGLEQIKVLLGKRWILLQSNWIPYLVAFLIPVVAAAVMQSLVSGDERATCTPQQFDLTQSLQSLSEQIQDGTGIIAGPPNSAFADNSTWLASNGVQIRPPVTNATSIDDLRSLLESERKTVWPGGFWAAEATSDSASPPTIAYRADTSNPMLTAVIAQNLMDRALLAVRIAVGYVVFDMGMGNVGKNLQLAIYFSIVLGIAPAFLSMYVNLERRNGVRGLQYSSGVRVVPQWLSHLLFDFGVMVLPVLAAALIFCFSTGTGSSSVFWMPGLLVPVFLLYTVAAILMGYIISLRLGSQLATWAAVGAANGIGLAVYFIAFIFIISLSPPTSAQSNVMVAHYVISIVFPLGSLMRAMLVSLNVFFQACDGAEFVQSPGAMRAFGAPILYLVLQSLLYFGILWVNDSRVVLAGLFSSLAAKKSNNNNKRSNGPAGAQTDIEMAIGPVALAGLEVKRLTKNFGNLRAVNNVSFEVQHGEVFALLGPNGAGKSTTISMIRGDMLPGDGDVLVEQQSIKTDRAAARARLGVCPQADALDALMTAEQHLRHYARLRGIADVDKQVGAVLAAVGLAPFRHVAASHLSGGNRRKLSLGIALTGNPAVLLLDEPSSGLDAAAKRIMWNTLKAVSPGRAILLTTHSMEEADTLAHRAGILARSMLAVGDVAHLQRRFGDSLHVHLVSRSAPHSGPEEMRRLRDRVLELLPGAEVEDKTYHGQMRFSVPAASVMGTTARRVPTNNNNNNDDRDGGEAEQSASTSAIGQLLLTLEDNSERLGIRHYSVAPTTLNDVFLAIVGEHQVKEEGYRAGDDDGGENGKKNWRKILLGF
ncbi:uncharacterized protein B0I36DRAFT_245663 [Microdochium trichocladiopsis]|uniref:ABC transporter domain-containing protein n=1 Tax=Microdochium trichocladiopsis TaxID=1682393 RepID=A0A9P9BPW6_9PEZI|nr:uncharacterized protein B0I36DRAFT_245663 [Microdochium trichocladiopsis]KAH7029560.1 hypothetical protein B0I36DRAFT_245663 [Microdochium trichocladiopsis]